MHAVEGTRQAIRHIARYCARLLDRLSAGRVTPNGVTVFGLVMHLPIALLIGARRYWWAAALLILFGLFDALDGELARLQQRTSPQGMFLDSVTDRLKEVLLYTAAAYAIIADTGRPYLAVWAVAACGCSLLVSYVNAWGEAVMARSRTVGKEHVVNKSFRGGLLPFEIRMAVLIIGLLSGRIALAVIVITLGAAYTALVRLANVLGRLGQGGV